MIRAGDLKHRMAIQEVTLTSDGMGGAVSVWSDVSGMSSVPFSLWPLSVKEATTSLKLEARMTHRLRIRYRPGVAQKMRGVFGTIGTGNIIGDSAILMESGTYLLLESGYKILLSTGWSNVDLNAYDETDDLTITASAIGQYCTFLVASAPTTIGKRYRLYYDLANIVSTWKVRDFTGTQTLGTISANATQATIEFTAATAGGLRLVAGSATSSGDFDNFKLQEIRVFDFKDIRNMGERDVALEIIVEEITDQ